MRAAKGRLDSPWHVQNGQLHRQRRYRAGVRPRQGRVLLGQGVARLRVLQVDLSAYIVHWDTRRRQVKLKELTPEEFLSQFLSGVVFI